ncbi:MAG: hypothetical protein VB078_00340 [Clostridiaceae bacterium]|nr:hypothetical protein [Clostridiaceae bacterium]
MRIVDLVEMNSHHAYVLDNEYKLTYEKHGNLLIGSDETNTFFDVLIYEYPRGRKEYGGYAFGGREFDVDMKDGTKTRCWGQYWSGGFREAEKILGITFADMPHNTIVQLQSCYVFCGGTAHKAKLEQMLNTFFAENPGYKAWNYWEYEKHIKNAKGNPHV